MIMIAKMRISLAAVSLLVASPAFADEATEARLREALRAATEQVQQLQQEKAALQAQPAPAPQAAAPEPPKDNVSQAKYNRAVSDASAQHQADHAEIARLKSAVDDATKAAGTRDADKSKSEASLMQAQARIKTLEGKNAKLVEISNDLLTRYENISWGDVMGAKEPFVGTKRVELQNIAQDYGDKISDSKVEP
ncbi:MAG TPA: hypothetical protein VGM26_17515 [Rhizomicrobium sp.]|jgi:type IV secretory pathway VirB10-like protein